MQRSARWIALMAIAGATATGSAQPMPPRPTTPDTDPDVHPVVYAFHRGYRGASLDPTNGVLPEELARFDAVIRTGTAGGDRTRLAFLAADRAVRSFAPILLAAVGHEADAARLRAIPPITSTATAHSASVQCEEVRTAITRAPDLSPSRQPGGTVYAAMLSACSAVSNSEAAVESSPTAERSAADAGSDAAHVAFNAQWVLRSRERERAAVVASAIQLLTELGNAARPARAAPRRRRPPRGR